MDRVDRPENRTPFTVNGQTVFPSITDEDFGGLRTYLSKRTASGATFSLANVTDYDRWNLPLNQTNRKVSSDWTTSFEVRWN